MTRDHLADLRRFLPRMVTARVALVALPAVTLLAHRVMGDDVLLAIALVLPVAVVLLSARPEEAERPAASVADPAAALPGRPEFLHYLGTLRARIPAPPTACLVLRLDRAETGAPETGGRALAARTDDLARRIRPALHPGDAIARLDEATLAVAMGPGAEVTLETAIQAALRLQRQADLAPPGAPAMSASVGVSLSARMPDAGPMTLLAAAEAALRDAQRAGRRDIRVHCADDHAAPPIQIGLAHDLADGFAERRIGAWFQPQINTDTGELTGVEALVRWDHPRHGILSPGDFLPTVEAAGLMSRLTDTMLEDGLAALAEWDLRGIRVPRVSVNFTPEDLADPDLADRVAWALDRHGLDGGRLGIEVLETVLNQGADDRVPRNLKALKAMGCMIDLDDFGTGNASISNIRRFSVDRLKIDRAFIRDIDTDRDQQGMVAAILTMAEQLGIEALAEGIETQGEYAMLSQLGCTHVQGFGIGRPMGVSSLPGWLARLRENRPVPALPAAFSRPAPSEGHGPATRRRPPHGRGKTA